MGSISVSMLRSFIVLTAFIFAVAGCGSSGSNSSATNSGTGSIAAKLVWSSEAPKTAKTLFAFPTGVTSIKIYVQDSSNNNLLPFPGYQEFTDSTASSGTITGIPAGDGRKVRVEGLGPHGSQAGIFLTYLGTAMVNVVAGSTPTPVTINMEAPVTRASPETAPSAASFPVTLTTSVPATIYYTTSEPATIYYTTNGDSVTTSSPHALSPVSLSITPPVTLKFFAVVRGLYEAIREKTY